MNSDEKSLRELRRIAIQQQYAAIDFAQQQIVEIAKEAIPNYHFLDHKVSTFWDDCENSPIGYCVWNISSGCEVRHASCYYCGDPVERK